MEIKQQQGEGKTTWKRFRKKAWSLQIADAVLFLFSLYTYFKIKRTSNTDTYNVLCCCLPSISTTYPSIDDGHFPILSSLRHGGRINATSQSSLLMCPLHQNSPPTLFNRWMEQCKYHHINNKINKYTKIKPRILNFQLQFFGLANRLIWWNRYLRVDFQLCIIDQCL